MVERNERLVYDGSKRRTPDRRQTQRRKSDMVKTYLKYLAVAVVVAVLVKLLG
ncbi:MAG TPA: hypothetical protein VGK14_02500 [Novimethylophilus sp.]|jgi:hypothetical protein|uniref:hypothetical protein n=1 Tax=Novimethylophilus sp. TaxID=2137426 RepID=UPI002F42382D